MYYESELIDDDEVNYDLIIIGAGAAGLSLLIALDEVNYCGTVLILETNGAFKNDRVWSFWQTSDVPTSINKIIEWRWNSWSLSHQNETVVLSDKNIPYCCLPATKLHQLAGDVIQKRQNVTIAFGHPVDKLSTSSYQNFVQCKEKTYSSNYVVDTRPPSFINNTPISGELSRSHLNIPKYGLLQCFFGLEIETTNGVFGHLQQDVKLMHDLTGTQDGLEFVYILPFSATHALIEFTGFYSELPDNAYLSSRANEYVIKTIADTPYKKLREEKACLPMYNISQTNTSTGIINGGIAGGTMRASTGYSFLSIQRWARKTARLLHNEKRLVWIDSIPMIYRWMDRVFLRVLIDNKKRNPQIFMRFAKSVSAATFARFMSEKATCKDLCKVILAMPKWPFIKAAIQTIAENER
ncbi:MAG: lycopene cyclase family protein [Pseudomonadota bacterium]